MHNVILTSMGKGFANQFWEKKNIFGSGQFESSREIANSEKNVAKEVAKKRDSDFFLPAILSMLHYRSVKMRFEFAFGHENASFVLCFCRKITLVTDPELFKMQGVE